MSYEKRKDRNMEHQNLWDIQKKNRLERGERATVREQEVVFNFIFTFTR